MESTGSCRYLGFIDDKDLPGLYACADAFVIPSTYEGMPLSVLEAMASGLPVICSQIEAFDFVVHNEAGAKIPFGNRKAAIAELERFLASDLAKLGRNGRHAACIQFDWDLVADHYSRIFRMVGS